MLVNIVVPPLGESVTEATLAKWHKNIGDFVKVDELLVELETDKVTLEVNAPSSGKLESITVKETELIGVGKELGRIDQSITNDSTVAKPNVANATANSTEAQSQNSYIASPAANKIAKDNNILMSEVNASGKDGRITKSDIMNIVNQDPANSSQSTNDSTMNKSLQLNDNENAKQNTNYTFQQSDKGNGELQKRVRMSKLRKTIAERLKYSQNTAAILTTFNEIDMSEVFRLRKQYQEKFIEKHKTKLGFMSFFIKAAIAALKNIPAINAQIEGDDIVYNNYYNIGVAVGTDQGLVVPVIRNADHLSFSDIELSILELGKKAKDSKLSIQDMLGATFTITNGGTYGSLLSTPIINPPQSGILGMHNIVERPVVVNGQIVIRPMMYVALSYDHRIIDGKEAVTFLVKIKQLVENPEKLLFDL